MGIWTGLAGMATIVYLRADGRVQEEMARRGLQPKISTIRNRGLRGSAAARHEEANA
jgi:hypothetical protein